MFIHYDFSFDDHLIKKDLTAILRGEESRINGISIIYRMYQNDWSGFEVNYIHKYGEQNYKY